MQGQEGVCARGTKGWVDCGGVGKEEEDGTGGGGGGGDVTVSLFAMICKNNLHTRASII